jgi:exopolyphosphatase/pppGpp-phosphohydrolase
MSQKQIVKILKSMAEEKAICRKIVNRLISKIDEFTELCLDSQQREADIYKNFFCIFA